MFKKKDYKSLDIILILLKLIPFQIGFFILNMVLNGLLPAYQTLIIGYFIDTATNIFNNNIEFNKIYSPIFLIMLSIIYSNFMPTIIDIIYIKVENKLNLILKSELLLKQSKLKYKYIEDSEILDLINRVYFNSTQNFINIFNNILSIISIIISTISIFLIIMSYNFYIGIIIVLFSIPLFYIATKTGKQTYNMNLDIEKIKRRYNYLGNILKDRIFAEERKLFNYSNNINNKFGELCDKSYNIEKKIQIKSFINLKSGSIISLMISIIIIFILLNPLYKKEISIGIFIGLTNAIFSLVQTMSWQLSFNMFEFARMKEYLKDFSSFIKLEEKDDAIHIPNKNINLKFKSLEFKNVSFKYPNSKNYILKNCCFKLENNKNYAFVGENGAGKSTIIKLITGLYDDYEGEILINDINIKDYKFSDLKGLISVAYQDFAKYFLTLKENIVFGDITKYDKDELKTIINKLGLENLILNLNEGINTYLGKIKKNGVDLSGGQWQKIAIARLLYSNAQINILDEPTSALDPIEESKVYETFRNINLGRFTIYITHRLGVVKTLDEVLVLSNGHIVEKGTHIDLMNYEDGVYKKMFESQKSWYN